MKPETVAKTLHALLEVLRDCGELETASGYNQLLGIMAASRALAREFRNELGEAFDNEAYFQAIYLKRGVSIDEK